MSDFLYNLVAMDLNLKETIQPRLNSVFEPTSASGLRGYGQQSNPEHLNMGYSPEENEFSIVESDRIFVRSPVVNSKESQRSSIKEQVHSDVTMHPEDVQTKVAESKSRQSQVKSARKIPDKTQHAKSENPTPSLQYLSTQNNATRGITEQYKPSSLELKSSTYKNENNDEIDFSTEKQKKNTSPKSVNESAKIKQVPLMKKLQPSISQMPKKTEPNRTILKSIIFKNDNGAKPHFNREKQKQQNLQETATEHIIIKQDNFTENPKISSIAHSEPVNRVQQSIQEQAAIKPQVTSYVEPKVPKYFEMPEKPLTEKTIQVSIGRIEIKAMSPSSETTKQKRISSPVMDLDEYLRHRNREGKQ